MQNILIVDDHGLINELLTDLLAQHYNVVCVRNAEQMRSQLQSQHFAAALIDINLESKLSGLDLMPEIAAHGVNMAVLSGQLSQANIRAAIRLGAHGIIDKAQGAAQVLPLLRKVINGEQAIPAHILKALVQETPSDLPLLSPREEEVLSLLCLYPDENSEQLGRRANITGGAIKNNITALYRLFDTKNRYTLLKEADRRGFKPLAPREAAMRVRAQPRRKRYGEY